jgi:hypothetical protein
MWRGRYDASTNGRAGGDEVIEGLLFAASSSADKPTGTLIEFSEASARQRRASQQVTVLLGSKSKTVDAAPPADTLMTPFLSDQESA